MAEAMRQYASGTITNDQFVDRLMTMSSEDDTTRALFSFAWIFFDDIYKHRRRGKNRLTKEGRQVFGRCVLFLRSDNNYSHEDPVSIPVASTFFTVLWRSIKTHTSPWTNWMKVRADIKNTKNAFYEGYWPFANRDDYNEALKHPVYLAGTA